MSDDADITRRIALGLDIERLMGTDIGRYLQQRAQDKHDAALEALSTVDPEDARAVRALQNEAAVARMFLEWLGEAVTEGEQAQMQLEQQDRIPQQP